MHGYQGKSWQSWLWLGVVLVGVGCGGGSEKAFAPDASSVTGLITVQAEPDQVTRGESIDGKLEILIPAGALAEAKELTVGMLKREDVPKDILSDVYVLGPPMQFAIPVRLTMKFTLPAGQDPSKLRLVHMDTGTDSYAVLDDWVYMAGGDGEPGAFSGTVNHFSAFGLTNGSGRSLTNDTEPDLTKIGDVLLARREIEAAHTAYLAAAEADPQDLQARFGAALTGMFKLPAHTAFNNLFIMCGEGGYDILGQIFGPDGVLSWLEKYRQGKSTVSLLQGVSPSALTQVEFAPNSVGAELYQDEQNGIWQMEVELEDFHSATLDRSATVRIKVQNVNDARWASGQNITLPSDLVHVEVRTWDDSGDDNVNVWTDVVSGSFLLTQAAKVDGQALDVQLLNVLLEQKSQMEGSQSSTVIGYFKLSGQIQDTLMAEFEPEVPFKDLDYLEATQTAPAQSEMIQIMDKCGNGLTMTYLMNILDQVAAEIDAILAHLDAIAGSAQASAFLWNLPVGALVNRVEVPISIVEVQLLRTALHGFRAIHELVGLYEFISPSLALKALHSDYTWYDEECETCGTEWRHDMDMKLLFDNLDPYFLAPKSGITLSSQAVAPIKTQLQLSIQAALAALQVTPPSGAMLNFQASGFKNAAAEIKKLLDLVLASMSADAPVTGTPEWIFHAHKFFTSPFDRASILAGAGVASLFGYTAADAQNRQNASLEPDGDALEYLMKIFITVPEGPSSSIYCSIDADCQGGAGGQSYWVCTDEVDFGVCSNDQNISCSDNTPCGGNPCLRKKCEARDPALLDSAIMDPAMDASPPAFVNEPVINEILGGL